MNADDIATLIMTTDMTNDELNLLIHAVRYKRERLQTAAKNQLSIGERVKFDSGRKGIITGILQKKNPKTLIVKSDAGVTWRVSPNLVQAA